LFSKFRDGIINEKLNIRSTLYREMIKLDDLFNITIEKEEDGIINQY